MTDSNRTQQTAADQRVYKRAFELADTLCAQADNVPVKWRRVLWEKTLDVAMDLLARIVYAYDEKAPKTRLAHLDRALSQFTVLNTYISLCNRHQVLPLQKQTNIAELMTDISQQLGGWRKATARMITSV